MHRIIGIGLRDAMHRCSCKPTLLLPYHAQVFIGPIKFLLGNTIQDKKVARNFVNPLLD